MPITTANDFKEKLKGNNYKEVIDSSDRIKSEHPYINIYEKQAIFSKEDLTIQSGLFTECIFLCLKDETSSYSYTCHVNINTILKPESIRKLFTNTSNGSFSFAALIVIPKGDPIIDSDEIQNNTESIFDKIETLLREIENNENIKTTRKFKVLPAANFFINTSNLTAQSSNDYPLKTITSLCKIRGKDIEGCIEGRGSYVNSQSKPILFQRRGNFFAIRIPKNTIGNSKHIPITLELK